MIRTYDLAVALLPGSFGKRLGFQDLDEDLVGPAHEKVARFNFGVFLKLADDLDAIGFHAFVHWPDVTVRERDVIDGTAVRGLTWLVHMY